jgi:hypothetical protein
MLKPLTLLALLLLLAPAIAMISVSEPRAGGAGRTVEISGPVASFSRSEGGLTVRLHPASAVRVIEISGTTAEGDALAPLRLTVEPQATYVRTRLDAGLRAAPHLVVRVE